MRITVPALRAKAQAPSHTYSSTERTVGIRYGGSSIITGVVGERSAVTLRSAAYRRPDTAPSR